MGILGLILGMILLCYLCMKSVHPILASIVSASVIALFNGMGMESALLEVYAPGFAGFISGYFFRYLWGTIFGVLMEQSGAAAAVADGIVRVFGRRYCLIALPLTVAVLAYSGMAGAVSLFIMIPIFIRVFREANIPRRFIPGLFCFGSGTFINCAPGSAQNLNVIATRSVGLEPSAGVLVGVIGSAVVLVLGLLYTYYVTHRAMAAGECFQEREGDCFDVSGEKRPPIWLAFLPMLVVILGINLRLKGQKLCSVETAVFLGCVATAVCMHRYLQPARMLEALGKSAEKTMTMLAAVSAMTGFGKVIMATAAYGGMTDWALNLNISPYICLAVAMNVVCAATASATSAISIVGPTLGATFVDAGLAPEAVARVMAISATGFDSVPQNGTIAMLINVFCGESYRTAYPYVFVMNVLVPLVGSAATIVACMAIY